MKKHLLVISHEASRTGAVLVLLNLLQWFRQQNLFEITIILYRTGELEPDFRAVGNVYIWNKEESSQTNTYTQLVSKIQNKLSGSSKHKYILEALRTHKWEAVYINTALAARILPEIASLLHCPIFCHIHELEIVLQTYCRLDKFSKAEPFITHYITASEAVKQNLIENKHISLHKPQHVVYEWIDTSKIRKPSKKTSDVKKELGIPENAFVVGGSGLVEWRKGADLFLMVADYLRLKNELNNTYFVWIGHVDATEKLKIDYELKRTGLNKQVIFTGKKENPQDYFQIFDVFALTSREDPFPLVVLEAAALKKPIVCFDQAGGIPEFVANGGGHAVSYLDIYAMAQWISTLRDDLESLSKMGEIAATQVEHYDVTVAGKKIYQLLEDAVARYSKS
ncbi:glycosyltransferase family 4 protein [Xanthocytophaga agilis]|uniref:Glycosyltransferase family 4 protein n=1 Tax=Xanthocytophaga agilis TaxID=3048010 RepID=A0AAE3UG81_9BACT|nr:glycosyltransferase family 4 protein [Xanthocytophaga agilis]MDJ1502187.1 glycosyltransferase family 4 protein [Xanthocytophaga agilis]